MKNCRMLKASLIVIMILFTLESFAQISITTSDSHIQNFTALPVTGSPVWVDNSTLASWYSQRTGTGNTIVANDGTNTAVNLYSYGTGTSTDRALGTIGSTASTSSNFAHGVLLKNVSGSTITDMRVTYTLEQWRNSGAAAQSITFYFKKSVTAISNLNVNDNATWTQVPALTLTSPVTGGTEGSLSGNAAANRVTASNISIPGLSLANNEYIMLKWEDPDHSGNDHGMGIDNVLITWQLPSSCASPLAVHEVQGNGLTSPYAGQVVSCTGVVTALKSNGFFLQTKDGSADADPNTSQGIFVFTSSAPPANAAIGNEVCVSGTVVEFIPANDVNSLSLTQIITPTVNIISTGNPLPTPVTLTSTDLNASNAITALEKFEGMRVLISSVTVVAPSEAVIDETNALATSSGYFYGVVTGTARPFREPGIQQPDPLPAGAPANVPRWDTNPEIIAIDSKSQPGSSALDVAVNAVVTNIAGPLDYIRRCYTIDVDASSSPGVTNNSLTFTAAPASATNEVSIASLNMRRFFDASDDGSITEPVLTATAFNNRLAKASLAIRNVLNYADVIGVQEVENLSTLQSVATKVNNDAVTAGQPNPNYQAYLVEGNDPEGKDVGFLIKQTKIAVVDVTQFGKTATYLNPNSGTANTLFESPPLLLRATITKQGCATAIPFSVIVNQFLSLGGIDDAIDGNRVRAKRKSQAEFLANLIQSRQAADATEKIISIGDFESYEFNDGYVDVMGSIKGTPAAANNVVLASADLVNPDLVNLIETHPAAQRYTITSRGSVAAYNHFLITQNISTQVTAFSIARIGADFQQSLFANSSRPEGLTLHDVPVGYFNFSCPPATSLATHYFRTRQGGSWNDVNTWESSPVENFSSGVVTPATITPGDVAAGIIIMPGHVINVTSNVVVSNLILNSTGQVVVKTGVTMVVK